MKDNLHRAFAQVMECPEPELADTIWHTIARRNQKRAYVRLAVFSVIGVSSLVFLIPAFKTLNADLSQSGFYEYISLAFSSGGSIFSYWQDFLSLLAESLPVVSIVSLLSLIFIFGISVKYALRQIINNQLTVSF